MVGPELSFIDGDAALQQWFGLAETALHAMPTGKRVERAGDIKMVRSQCLLANGKGLLREGDGIAVSARLI